MKSRREMLLNMSSLGAGVLVAGVAGVAHARSLTVSASPSSLSGAGWDLTGSTTASASGGTPPYSYQWVHLSGTGYVQANDPTGESTNFYWDGPWGGPPKFSRWACVVTDAANVSATSNTVTIDFDPTL